MQGSHKQQRMVTGMFRDRDSAERAYQSSTARGYSDRDINLAMSEDTSAWWLDETGAWTRHSRDESGAPLDDMQNVLMREIMLRRRASVLR